jgi:hypothetical protein
MKTKIKIYDSDRGWDSDIKKLIDYFYNGKLTKEELENLIIKLRQKYGINTKI